MNGTPSKEQESESLMQAGDVLFPADRRRARVTSRCTGLVRCGGNRLILHAVGRNSGLDKN